MPRGAKPKVYDPALVELVAELYSAGHTQEEVAYRAGVSQKVVWNLMRRNGLPTRKAAKRDQNGSRNASWKGVKAGYQALHLRVQVALGKPSFCGRCGSENDPTKTYEWASLTGDYTNIADYERMCRSCHRRYDFARRSGVMSVA